MTTTFDVNDIEAGNSNPCCHIPAFKVALFMATCEMLVMEAGMTLRAQQVNPYSVCRH